jgi:hypothetical protein
MRLKQRQSETTTGRIPACGRSPANPKSEARSTKQTQNPNARNDQQAISVNPCKSVSEMKLSAFIGGSTFRFVSREIATLGSQ